MSEKREQEIEGRKVQGWGKLERAGVMPEIHEGEGEDEVRSVCVRRGEERGG